MKIKKIDKKKLFTKALEDGIKKTIELGVIGVVAGLSLNTLLLAVAGIMGGSLYCENNQANFIGKNLKGDRE